MGHAYLGQPPGRSSAWRAGFPTPKNYNDNGLNCGGFGVQYGVYGGMCGLCGDPYGGPRPNEPGPDNVYATGTIVANYTQGQSVAVKIHISASHLGYHEFRLFKNDAPQRGRDASVAVKCNASSTLLASPDGRTKFDEKDPNIVVQLPTDVVCDACVLQWKWRTGNSWGCDADGCGMGYGNQEEFYGCADVRIAAGRGAAGWSSHSPSTAPTATTALATPRDAGTKASAPTASQSASERPTTVGGAATAKPTPTQTATSAAATPRPAPATVGVAATTTSRSSTTAGGTEAGRTGSATWTCKAREPYPDNVQQWCDLNCNRVPRYCPPTHCVCTRS